MASLADQMLHTSYLMIGYLILAFAITAIIAFRSNDFKSISQ